MPKSLKEKIDLLRGDIPRSRFISKVLEETYTNESTANIGLKNQKGESRPQPISPTADSAPLDETR